MRTAAFTLVLLAFWTLTGSLCAQVPEWIWHPQTNAAPENDVRYFRKAFKVAGHVSKVVLSAAADNEALIFLNGKQVASSKRWQDVVQLDVSKEIQPGDNVFAVRCKGGQRTAGFIARLEITQATVAGEANEPENVGQRRVQFVVTDGAWLTAATEPAGWQGAAIKLAQWTRPVSLGKLGIQPWGDLLAPRTATPAAELKALPGFKVELLRSARIDEGTWVCMTFDPKGRLLIAPDPGGLLRLSLNREGHVAKVEKLNAPINGAQGLLWAFDSLYVNNARGPQGDGFYRLWDKDDDGRFERVKLLRTFARSDHGPHAVVLGPDRKIYLMNGNFSGLPADLDPRSPHRHYAEDLLLPRQWDPGGHAVGVLSPGGYVARLDRDGKRWELLLAGFRNPYDIAFNPDGELFTYDADMEWDIGAPWYRPTRINHCVTGGESGWRSGSGKWPEYYFDSLPAAVDIGKGSPTGVAFGTGAKFPPKYQRAFYALDWAYGKIFAVHLTPSGASYNGTFETFLEGRPLNVTDVAIGRDGAMYFITGGWNTQSGLYRVTHTGPQLKEPSQTSAQRQADREAAKARALRHKLEAFHGKENLEAIVLAWPELQSEDRWIRYAARIAIESQPVAVWKELALTEKDPNAGLTALLALARCGSREDQRDVLAALMKFPFAQLSEARKLDKLRVLAVSFARHGGPDGATVAPVLAELDPQYPAGSEALNRELCQVLIFLEAPGVVQRTLKLMATAPTPAEQMHYAFHLRTVQRGWTMDGRKAYFAWLNKAETGFTGGNSLPKYLANMKKDAVARLTPEQRTELASVIGETTPVATAPPPATNRKFVREWKMDDLSGALDGVSTGRSFPKGRQAMIDAQCLACHRFGNEGGSVGPDLTAVASRFGRRELLESVLVPSKVIGFQYENTVIVKQDQSDVTGKLVDEDDKKVVLLTDPLTQQHVEVLKQDIAGRRLSTVSPMPEGLVNILTREEILDLLALLESGGRRNHTAFNK